MCADDEKIEAEMKRRDLWKLAQENAALGQSFVMTHTTPAGIEAFLWFGDPNDGGFIWYSMPAAKEMPEEVASSILDAFSCRPPVFGGGSALACLEHLLLDRYREKLAALPACRVSGSGDRRE